MNKEQEEFIDDFSEKYPTISREFMEKATETIDYVAYLMGDDPVISGYFYTILGEKLIQQAITHIIHSSRSYRVAGMIIYANVILEMRMQTENLIEFLLEDLSKMMLAETPTPETKH
jgi:hypothetical protein